MNAKRKRSDAEEASPTNAQFDGIDLTGFVSNDDSQLIWPTDAALLTEQLFDWRVRVLQWSAQMFKNTRPVDHDKAIKLYQGLLALKVVQMTPKLKIDTKIDAAMNVVIKESFKFPEREKELARELKDAWEADNWGAANADDAEPEDEDEILSPTTADESHAPPSKKSRPTQPLPPTSTIIRRPPSNHPIFGVNGIMRGVLIKSAQRRSYLLDPHFAFEAPNPKKYGHNKLSPGDWFPFQITARARGAHGEIMAGITAGPDGAYSIVISSTGEYTKLDSDHGDTLLYSGSGSHENILPDHPPENARTRSLFSSEHTKKPVRVLRNGGNFEGTGYAHRCGMRYDGLYVVKDHRKKTNLKGGAYWQFQLKRLPGQDPIDLTRPTMEERKAYKKIADGY